MAVSAAIAETPLHHAVVLPTPTSELTFTETVEMGGTTFTQEARITPEPQEVAIMRLLFASETRRMVARVKEVLESDEWTPPAAG